MCHALGSRPTCPGVEWEMRSAWPCELLHWAFSPVLDSRTTWQSLRWQQQEERVGGRQALGLQALACSRPCPCWPPRGHREGGLAFSVLLIPSAHRWLL